METSFIYSTRGNPDPNTPFIAFDLSLICYELPKIACFTDVILMPRAVSRKLKDDAYFQVLTVFLFANEKLILDIILRSSPVQ